MVRTSRRARDAEVKNSGWIMRLRAMRLPPFGGGLGARGAADDGGGAGGVHTRREEPVELVSAVHPGQEVGRCVVPRDNGGEDDGEAAGVVWPGGGGRVGEG